METEALRLPGVTLKVHRYGGIEFVGADERELGHLHGHGLLDVWLDREKAGELIAAGQVQPHHRFPNSGWISYQLESAADVSFALTLLQAARNR